MSLSSHGHLSLGERMITLKLIHVLSRSERRLPNVAFRSAKGWLS